MHEECREHIVNEGQGHSYEKDEQASNFFRLLVSGCVSASIYIIVTFLSYRFEYSSSGSSRPILLVLVLLGLAFLGYLYSVYLANRVKQDGKLIWLIFSFALFYRLILLPSVPIQEIDVYRYIWDGAVLEQGISPFRYSPDQVKSAVGNAGEDEMLFRLMELKDADSSLAEILNRVHFGDLPTIYPVVSQLVFAGAAFTTPDGSSVMCRITIMKIWLLGFDLGTLLLLICILKRCNKPVGLCLLYAWCPLVLKEVANSGHLDVIAVFFTTLAFFMLLCFLKKSRARQREWPRDVLRSSSIILVLALGVGAKVYPIILAPLLFFTFIRRIGWSAAMVSASLFVCAVVLLFWPMIPSQKNAIDMLSSISKPLRTTSKATISLAGPDELTTDPSQGLVTFLRKWEMNDFLFQMLVENIKPTSDLSNRRIAWFSFVPNSMRENLVQVLSNHLGIQASEVPFILTRFITLALFAALAIWFAFRGSESMQPEVICEVAFLTIAWFWLLCPTQNPWYWIWAMPFLPFARSRAWLLVSGLLLIYYLRFWFSYHFGSSAFGGTDYFGPQFFDYVVVWLEFGPLFIFFGMEWFLRKRSAR